MSFSNLDYLYSHLPARFRISDAEEDLLLRRYLTWFTDELDGWDQTLDTFYQKIDPDTAPEGFVEFWLWALFGWAWYPSWFTLPDKRNLFRDFAVLLARRGTRRGIQDWLRHFSIYARVFNRPVFLEESYIGEAGWFVESPLGLVVRVSHLADRVNGDLLAVEEGYCEETFVSNPTATLSRAEIEDLLRFEWPTSQRLMIHYHSRRNVAGPEGWEDVIPLNEEVVPDESSGMLTGV